MTTIDTLPTVLRVRAALRAAGACGEPRVLDGSARTAQLAAEQLSCPVGAIANSLVFSALRPPAATPDDGPARLAVLVLTSGAHRVDTARVAALLGLAALNRADPEFVKASTGMAIGGVAPVGHPAPIRTVVDAALEQYAQVWAAAGHPRVVFPTSFAELIRITGGTPAVVGD